MKVSFVPVTDYAVVVEALATRKIDMVGWAASPSCRPACTHGTVVPLVQRAEDAGPPRSSSPPARASRALLT